MTRRRHAVTILELLVGITILALGFGPFFDLMRGTRGVLGTSREMLLLQNQALQALAEARGLVASGSLLDLAVSQEEVLEDEADGVSYRVTIARRDDGGYLLVSRAATDERFFQVAHVAADPYASFHRFEDEPLPDPTESDHDHEGDHW